MAAGFDTVDDDCAQSILSIVLFNSESIANNCADDAEAVASTAGPDSSAGNDLGLLRRIRGMQRSMSTRSRTCDDGI